MAKTGVDEQEPESKAETGPSGELTRTTHPAFAQIAMSRTSGHTTLYDSDFVHQHYVTIRVYRSERMRELARDWHYPTEELLELKMSESQWATFVSTGNVRGGTPCTLVAVERQRVPQIPLRRQEDSFRAEGDAAFRQAVAQLDEALAEVEGELGAALSKSKRDRVLGRIRAAKTKLADSIPYLARSFSQHMEETVDRAKVEVEAYADARVRAAGLQALEAPGVRRLGQGDATE
jgi:hypothetical protein